MFSNLMAFRKEIYKVSYPNRGMDEGFSVGLYYSHYLQFELKKTIRDNLEKIDDVLLTILDPQKREIGLPDLIEKYGYIDADLDAIDLEWRVENF